MQCQQCSRPAFYRVGDGSGIPLCLDCYGKLVAISERERAEMEREINYLSDEMEMIAGVRLGGPRYPERRPPVHIHGTTLNNIHIQDSAVGVLNTGVITSLDSAITVIRSSGQDDLAQALTSFTEAVGQSSALSADAKNEILECLGVLAAESAAAPEKRKKQVAKGLMARVGELLGPAANLATLWETVASLLKPMF